MNRALCLSLSLALVLVAPGCLGTTHRVSRSELMRLAQTPPEQRGDRVQVLQGFAGEDQPPGAPRVRAGAVIVVHGGGGGHVGPRRSDPSKLAKRNANKAKDYVILAAIAAIAFAATEGARYDGWVKVHPMHPVHMYGPYGEYGWVPLAQLDEQAAAWAHRAYIRPEEGPWTPLGRRPLDRQGWTYSLLLGSGQIPTTAYANDPDTSTNDPGFLSHIQIGVFPTQIVGVLFDMAFGWRNDEDFNAVMDARYALELQALPLKAGKIHAGGFGQVGSASLFDDGPGEDDRSLLLGGGLLLQLELTTRLTLTGRVGITDVHGATVQDITAGVSIY